MSALSEGLLQGRNRTIVGLKRMGAVFTYWKSMVSCNRTIVGLKHEGKIYVQAGLSGGCNRTIVGLKRRWAVMDVSRCGRLQSHHSGIETLFFASSSRVLE